MENPNFVHSADQLFKREDAAAYLDLKPQTLAKWAMTGRYDLPFIRVGHSVRYRRSDLDRWLESRRGTSSAALKHAHNDSSSQEGNPRPRPHGGT